MKRLWVILPVLFVLYCEDNAKYICLVDR